jgi:hypothetical protein
MSLADLMKKGSLRQFATVTVATVRPDHLPSVASVATVSVATAQKQAANDPAAVTHDPDRWAWPHSQAMTGREIDTFTARLHHFTRRGLLESDAETLADKLVKRDREADDRRLCLECAHLSRASDLRCNQWQQAGLGAPGITAGPHLVLQRCDGFKDHAPRGTP